MSRKAQLITYEVLGDEDLRAEYDEGLEMLMSGEPRGMSYMLSLSVFSRQLSMGDGSGQLSTFHILILQLILCSVDTGLCFTILPELSS
eukprot:scaffold15202_cov31-Prasinocladus_malaysianus.AAC.1